MKGYTQLTQEVRYQIWSLKHCGWTQGQIAEEIGYHRSTICRELKRNSGKRGYRPQHAHNCALARKREREGRWRISDATWDLVEEQLLQEWSPDQISNWIRQQYRIGVSHERIYQYVYTDQYLGGTLYKHLRCQKQRRKRYGKRDRRGCIPGRRSIDERPGIVEDRSRIGDWEVDTIIGKGHHQALVSLVERKSRLTLLHKVERVTAEAVTAAVMKLLGPYAKHVQTITSDNGKEFARHEQIAQNLNTEFFFAHPYCSWERGTNENTNGLVRQYFPKKQTFATITQKEVKHVMRRLNSRPRKTLNYKTPEQVFLEQTNCCT